jgi:PTH1 family peptidyl-tRNA hydrolase
LKLIVGLGNPGREYAATRHNVGWWAVDHLAERWGFDKWKKDGQALTSTGRLAESRVRLVKPQTYMNLSGNVLIQYRRRPTWNPSTDLLVILDEVALPIDRIRLRAGGSAGGHNGLKSVETQLGTRDYARLRIGIQPDHEIGDLADFVLAPFAKSEAAKMQDVITRVAAASERWVKDGILAAMNEYNGFEKTRGREDEKTRGREDE